MTGHQLYGDNGYPAMTPGRMWLATSVFSDGAHAWDDIYPSHDDPFHVFRTPENSPWLSRAEIDALNALHAKHNVHRRSVMRHCDPAYWLPLFDAEVEVARREPVRRRKFDVPHLAFETDVGGWMPNGGSLAGASITARDVGLRLAAKAVRDFVQADLIRRVILSGGVDLEDHRDGCFWFFRMEGACHG